MIKPNKLTDPYNCIIYYCFKVIKLLRNRDIELYILKNLIKKEIEEFDEETFNNSLSFLFLLNKLIYTENDVMRWISEIK